MNISESAVKNTLQQLFGKTEVRTRSQLVGSATQLLLKRALPVPHTGVILRAEVG